MCFTAFTKNFLLISSLCTVVSGTKAFSFLFIHMHSYVAFYLQDAQKECLLVNAPLICRASSRVPFSVLKYAMTLDGEGSVHFHVIFLSCTSFQCRISKLHKLLAVFSCLITFLV